MKKLVKILTGRLVITSIFILIQLLVMLVIIYRLSEFSTYIYSGMVILSLLFVILIVADDTNPTFKVAWLIPMLMLPLFGWLVYAVFGRRKITARTRRNYFEITVSTKNIIKQDESILNEIGSLDPSVRRQCVYLKKSSQATVFTDTDTHFFPTGESFFPVYLAELEKAERFIFLEYFIIEEGIMWSAIKDILVRKAAQGVDVRVMYDDMGTINVLKKGYDKHLRNLGIKVCIFNTFRPSLDVFMNYRDHRKITVIDGNVGFTGGLNLADEYINEAARFGYWKDCAIMIKGSAVSRLSLMFLQLWNFTLKEKSTSYTPYFATQKYPSDGYVAPFGDGPMSGHLTGELSYINILNNATRYVYILTPYLILDNEMITALKLAVDSGIDVRIVVPHIPDKWYVQAVTRSNFPVLIRAGVRIYEYTPGFMHSKIIVADDDISIVGTINFDFRSFYLHFENGIFMYKSKAIFQVKADYERVLEQSIEITPEFERELGWFRKLSWAVLRLFSPFL